MHSLYQTAILTAAALRRASACRHALICTPTCVGQDLHAEGGAQAGAAACCVGIACEANHVVLFGAVVLLWWGVWSSQKPAWHLICREVLQDANA